MNKEPKSNRANEGADPWDSLSGVPRNMSRHVMEFMERSQAKSESSSSPESQPNPEVKSDEEQTNFVGTTFEVGDRFTTKESEFKRITGEDWPGKKYKAVPVEGGAYGDNANSDFPLEKWEIVEAGPEDDEQSETEKTEEDEPSLEQVGAFQVAPGTTKEEEFKRLTGEDWPGVEYSAANIGIDDDGYDYPIEQWAVYRKAEKEPSQDVGNQDEGNQETEPSSDEDIENPATQNEDGADNQDEGNQETESSNDGEVEIVAIQDEDGTLTFPNGGDRTNQEPPKDNGDNALDLPSSQGNPNAIPLGPAQGNPDAIPLGPAQGNPNAIPLGPAGGNPDAIPLPSAGNNPNAIPLGPAGGNPDAIALPPAPNNANLEEEEKKKHELEELAKLEKEENDLDEEEKRLRDELEGLLEKEENDLDEEEKRLRDELDNLPTKDFGPLVAINADFTHDKKELAHDIAEMQLNEETSKAGLIKRIWKGNLFKKYFQKKRERELLSGQRLIDVEGTNMSIDEMIRDRSNSTIQRFVLGAVEGLEYVHTKIATNNPNTEDPGAEKLTEADSKTTEIVRNAIREFASAEIPVGGNLEDIKRDFVEKMHRIKAENHDEGKDDGLVIDNYLDVAIQARERAEHGIAIDRVMEGFKVYNAEVRDNVRTEAHRDAIDRIVNKYETSKFGSIIPPEIIAGALGTAMSLTQSGARALGGIGVGIGVSGLMSGLRERNRVTEDRARMMRDIANGGEYGREGSSRRSAKYEARIGGTLYASRPANELIDNINNAREGQDRDALLRAIAQARVRIDFSDSEQKDLISYTSTGRRGTERLELDMATIRAEKSLSPEDQEKVAAMRTQIQKEIRSEVDERDKDFRRIRTAQALKQAGKTILVGSAVFFASQEVMAAISPDKIGIFEKAGLLKKQNNADASETILAGAVGERGVQTIEHVPGDDTVRRDMLKDAGFTETQTSPGGTHVETTLVDADPKDSVNQVTLHRRWANNGTRLSDGNELRGYLQNGTMSSGMFNHSTLPDGTPIDYDAALAAGKVRAYVTVDGATFELAPNSGPNMDWGQNGVFTTTTGESLSLIGRNGERLYEYFEIGIEDGINPDGSINTTILATDPQLNHFGGKIQQVVERLVEDPAEYSYTKATPIFYGGVVAAPTARTGLGGPALRNQSIPPTRTEEPSGQGSGESEPGDGISEQTLNQPTGDNTSNQPAGDDTPEQPTDNGSPNQPAGDNTSDQPTGDGAPEQSSDGNANQADQSAQNRARREAERVFGYMGGNVVDLMSRTELLNNEEYASLPSWWGGLTDDERSDLRRWALNPNNDPNYGQGLRNFILNIRG